MCEKNSFYTCTIVAQSCQSCSHYFTTPAASPSQRDTHPAFFGLESLLLQRSLISCDLQYRFQTIDANTMKAIRRKPSASSGADLALWPWPAHRPGWLTLGSTLDQKIHSHRSHTCLLQDCSGTHIFSYPRCTTQPGNRTLKEGTWDTFQSQVHSDRKLGQLNPSLHTQTGPCKPPCSHWIGFGGVDVSTDPELLARSAADCGLTDCDPVASPMAPAGFAVSAVAAFSQKPYFAPSHCSSTTRHHGPLPLSLPHLLCGSV